MSEEIIQVGEGLMSQVERASIDINLSQALESFIDEINRVTGVPAEEESNEGSSVSGEISRMRDDERMEALASGNATVEQVLGIEQPEESSLSSEEETTEEPEVHTEIPVNSETLLVDDTTSRFSSAIWYENIQKKVITLAGVGGIGRFGNLVNF